MILGLAQTLQLPQTDFPMRANAKEREPKLLFSEYYQWQEKNNKGETFVLHDGPPYANGSPHIGHALNKILKDIICRYKSLRGHRVRFEFWKKSLLILQLYSRLGLSWTAN